MTDPFDADRGAPQLRRTPSRLPMVLAAVSLGIIVATIAVVAIALMGSSSAPAPVAEAFDIRPAAPTTTVPAVPTTEVETAPAPAPASDPADLADEETPAGSPLSGTPVPITSGRLDDVAARTGPIPVRLIIPAIGVDAEILPVGYADGEMEIPPTADTVGWYEYGPRPGEPGSSVLAAHVAWQRVQGAFWELHELPPGAEFEVRFDDGSIRRFRTVALETYDKEELPAADLFRRSGDAELTLITCGGAFNPSLGSYDSNVVATAVEIDRPMQ